MIGNILINIDDARADVESYVWTASVALGGRRDVTVCARHLDRFTLAMMNGASRNPSGSMTDSGSIPILQTGLSVRLE
jgi:hypothetical protein